MRFSFIASFVLTGVIMVAACAAPTDAPEATAAIGAPLADLDRDQLARFRAGETAFNRVFTPEEGIGPLFNENQCSACHTFPEAGGTGEQFLLKATRFQAPDRCDLMAGQGGDNIRTRSTPLLEAHGIIGQPAPDGATERGRFNVPFLFGLGLIEAIPDARILAHADPDDADGDGISGKTGLDAHGQLARFGRKADFATIRDFTEIALRFEMGLTTARHPDEGTIAGRPLPAGVDPAADPEVADSIIERLVDFVRFLAPPERLTHETAEDRVAAERGAVRFEEIGCARCHVPAMTTGRNDTRALDRKRIALYSDLLLHDLGPAFASVCGIAATPTELRTAPLMGLRHRNVFLHDGRTADLLDAILLHGGEASAVRERFRSLDRLEQEDVLMFLRTL
jgi:CxxC motif-containing protein (DUF1111 family)